MVLVYCFMLVDSTMGIIMKDSLRRGNRMEKGSTIGLMVVGMKGALKMGRKMGKA